MSRLGRYETAYLCHQGDEGGLAQECRLTRHVGTRDDEYLLTVGVEQNVICDITLSDRQLLLDDRMAPLTYIERSAVIYHRTHIAIECRSIGEREQAVEACYLIGINLYGRDVFIEGKYEVVIESCLECRYLVLCTENLLLILLEFLGDGWLCIDQGLFANPVLWDIVFVRIA